MRIIRLFFITALMLSHAPVFAQDASPAAVNKPVIENPTPKIEVAEPFHPLRAELLAILKADQKHRLQIAKFTKKFGQGSKELNELWDKIEALDKENLAKITAILDKHGWMGPEEVGADANVAFFLVIQHADLAVQQKYLPMMRDAVKTGKARADALALLEDRVALGEGRKQSFGSQIGFNQTTKQSYVRPLADPDNVDKRRASVGLEPLTSYVKQWEIVWDVEAYKNALPEIEKLEKEMPAE